MSVSLNAPYKGMHPCTRAAVASFRLHALEVFVAPGLHGSGPAHWQSAWERRDRRLRRIEQDDWSQPVLDGWARRIAESLVLARRPAVVVAHSFGCLATLRAAAFQSDLLAGALLVAPAHPDRFDAQDRLPIAPLSFPLAMVTSDNDPWMPLTEARRLAVRWGADLTILAGAGHVNGASGHTEWPEGARLLEDLCARAAVSERRRR